MQRTEYWGISLRPDEGEMPASFVASDVPTLKRGLGTALCLGTGTCRAHPSGWVLRAALACFVLATAACGGAHGPHAGAVAPAAHDSAVARTVHSLGAAIAQVAQDSAAAPGVCPRAACPSRCSGAGCPIPP